MPFPSPHPTTSPLLGISLHAKMLYNRPLTEPRRALTIWTTSNVLAGSDTTAILLRATVYFLLRHPPSLHRLRAERDAASPSVPVSWAEARDLPFLDAVIKEAGRLHPAKGLPLERVVPEGGAVICGEFLREGTVVGISAWVCHRDKGLFGEDAEERKSMERGLLTVSFLDPTRLAACVRG